MGADSTTRTSSGRGRSRDRASRGRGGGRPTRRFVKKQQIRWTPRGAHLLLQTRTHVLNDELAATFGDWYPGVSVDDRVATMEPPPAA
jgi:hypothetical protein